MRKYKSLPNSIVHISRYVRDFYKQQQNILYSKKNHGKKIELIIRSPK